MAPRITRFFWSVKNFAYKERSQRIYLIKMLMKMHNCFLKQCNLGLRGRSLLVLNTKYHCCRKKTSKSKLSFLKAIKCISEVFVIISWLNVKYLTKNNRFENFLRYNCFVLSLCRPLADITRRIRFIRLFFSVAVFIVLFVNARQKISLVFICLFVNPDN